MGTVSVRVVRGTGLLAADSGGTSDPYVLVSLPTCYDGGNSARSSAKKKTLDPVWEETLGTLSVYDAPDRCVISFSVWDHDALSVNDDLGRGEALPNPNPKPNPKVNPNPKVSPDPNPDPNPSPDPNPNPDPNPDPKPNRNPKPNPDPKPNPKPNPSPHPSPNPNPNPSPHAKQARPS